MLAFVNRPIMATAINLVLVIIGLVALKQLPLRHHTHSAELAIMVSAHYPGANSQVIEQRVTKPLENALAGIDGLRHTTSKSHDGFSEIHIRFRKNYSPERAMNEVRDRVQATQSLLPKEVEPPFVFERGMNEEDLMYIAFQDKTRSSADIFDYIRRNVLEQLKLVEGVAEVGDFGGTPYVIECQIDPAELIHYQLSLNDVLSTLKSEKTFASGGQIQSVTGKKTIVIEAPFDSPEAIAHLPLVTRDNKIVRLRDVAEVVLRVADSDFSMRVDGVDTVGLTIKAKIQANPIEVSQRVTKFIHQLQATLPQTMQVSVLFDRTKTFEAGLNAIQHSLWEAIILVGVIVTISLSSLRAAVVPMITVPLCLVSTFGLMWLFNFSINPVTLLAMVLAVGLVVDDAIVVVENIHRHMESGFSALDAARKGMKEITFAVIVMTLTLVAVYLPVAFQIDSSAVVFREFAWTLAGSVLISGFVALTLTPAMCGRWLSGTALVDQHSRAERIWQQINCGYQAMLAWVMQKRLWVIFFALVVFGLSIWLFTKLPSEFQPFEDEDYLFGWMSAETEVTPAVKASWDKQIEQLVAREVPEATRFMLGTWRNNYWWSIYLEPRHTRSEGSDAIAKRLQTPLADIAGPMVGVNLAASGSDETNNLEVVVRYSGAPHVLLESMRNLVDNIEKIKGVMRVDSKEVKLQNRYHVKVIREVAASLGIHVDAIEDVLYTFFSGKKGTEITFDGYDYNVIVTTDPAVRAELSSINQFFVNRPNGIAVPLGTLVEIEEVLEPEYIKHYEQVRSAKLDIYLDADLTIAEALAELKPLIHEQLPSDALVTFSGAAEKYEEAKRAMWLTLGLAIAFIFLILAALFESILDPFIVLLTVPLSVLGAVLAIYWTGGSNNIYMQMGIVTLIGLITKHGILITDFANRLRLAGHSIQDAVIQAAVARLRPILMTTLAMIFGAIPLVLSLGAGANARSHLGWVIIGGMTSGTLFSLFVIPVVYYYVARLRKQSSSSRMKSSPIS